MTASPANSPRTNPTRPNNTREELSTGSRASSGRGTPSEQGIGVGEGVDAILRDPESASQGKDSVAKLNQVIQNYFTKCALTILDSRVSLSQAYSKEGIKRVNKWFNVEINETDVLRDDLRLWRSCDAISHRPLPMIVELYVDAQELTNSQSLVIIDEQGRRWDVEEALNKSPSSSAGGSGQSSRSEVVIERWVVQLGQSPGNIPQDLSTNNPRTYKNIVVLLRSLYTYSRLLPAWKSGKRSSKTSSVPKLPKLRYRITQGLQSEQQHKNDQLAVPLFKSDGDVLDTFVFDPIDSPAGPLCLQVTYRNQCDFRVDTSEAFLSSRFMGMDDQYFEPSLGRREDASKQRKDYAVRPTSVAAGSLPHNRRDSIPRPDQGQAYGSMSTFHQPGPATGSSPLSALRAARNAGSESPEDMVSRRAHPNMRSAQGSRSSLRSADGGPGVGRRPSVSFMPFKSPSLSASPSQAEQLMTSVPRGSLGKASPLAALAEARAPSTLGPYGSVPSRGSPNAADVPSPISNSPKPGPQQRYSSSFGHRKAKLSTGGSSRTEDDNSSGKASLTLSNAQPGSGVLAEGGGASSGSIQTDDDNISDFLKLLDQKKDLKSFRNSNDQAATEASARRTSAALNKFQRMRDTNDALYSSMSSSHLLHRSSSSSSRQLSSVPPMVAGTSISPSSSPGKPISPHTPHTPAVPSRLSANSTIEYPRRVPSRGEDRRPRPAATHSAQDARSNRDSSTGAIDIPNSPRPFHPSYRRSSSAAQQARNLPYDDDEIFPFGMRSASLGVDDRPSVSLGVLAGMHEGDAPDDSAVAEPSVETREATFGSRFDAERSNRPQPSSFERREEAGSLQARVTPYRPRIGRGSGKGTPPQASSSSLAERGSVSGSSDHRGSRSSFTRPPSNFEDEEPLLFAMSDFGAAQQSHRSLEENRGGERGGSDSGASSRRGSRRGGC
ncbi:MAG: autophagy protein 13 [Alectoria sarmentosa]|nr:MAG: autophagy protein 13 [Alectoria sarmentosa]